MKYDKLMIDVSNFCNRAFYVSESEKTEINGYQIYTLGIIKSIQMLKSVMRKFLREGGKVYLLFDNCHSGINRRKEIDPDYKANRSKKDDGFYRSMDLFHEIMLNYSDNIVCVQKQGYEADDLVKPLCERFEIDEILLISNDEDWFRAIKDKVHVAKYEYKLKDYVIFNKQKFYEVYHFEASENSMILYKTLKGDGSDNIPNITVGLKTELLERLCTDYKSISDLYKRLDNNLYISQRFKDKLWDNKSRAELNEKLVSFEKLDYSDLDDSIFYCKFNKKTLKCLYEGLGYEAVKVDERLVGFEEEKPEDDSFFTFEKA